MSLVAVKNKYQVVIPRSVREQIRLSVGDLLEARAERGKITLTPSTRLDHGIAEGLEDIKRGRVYGPYQSVAAAMKAFQRRTGKATKRQKRTPS